MPWYNKYLKFGKKALPTPSGQAIFIDAGDRTLTRALNTYVTEGYAHNATVFSCIQRIMKAAASVELNVKKGDGTVLTEHPVLELLSDPNPTQEGSLFLQELVMWHRVAGEAFVVKTLSNDNKILELYCLDPSKVTVIRDANSPVPVAYEYGTKPNVVRYPVAVDGTPNVMHIKTPNPTDPWRGLSPLSAGARAVDMSNEGLKWNAKLLGNSAQPSGIITMDGTPSETVVEQVRRFFRNAYQGADKAGSIPLLTGGIKFQPLSMNPKDMDYASTIAAADKNIALIYGVPLPLVTMEAATFSNMDTAMELLWTDTVLPLLDEIIEALSDFLMPHFINGKRGSKANNEALELCYNADSVPALEGRRKRLYGRMKEVVSSGLLTINEARREMGFDPVVDPRCDTLLIPSNLSFLGDNPNPTTALVDTMKRAGFSDEEVAKTMLRDFGVKVAA